MVHLFLLNVLDFVSQLFNYLDHERHSEIHQPEPPAKLQYDIRFHQIVTGITTDSEELFLLTLHEEPQKFLCQFRFSAFPCGLDAVPINFVLLAQSNGFIEFADFSVQVSGDSSELY